MRVKGLEKKCIRITNNIFLPVYGGSHPVCINMHTTNERLGITPYSILMDIIIYHKKQAGGKTEGAPRHRQQLQDILALMSDMAGVSRGEIKYGKVALKIETWRDFISLSRFMCSSWEGIISLARGIRSLTAITRAVKQEGGTLGQWFAGWHIMLNRLSDIQAEEMPGAGIELATQATLVRHVLGLVNGRPPCGNETTEEHPVQILPDYNTHDEMCGMRDRHRVQAMATVTYTLCFNATRAILEAMLNVLMVDKVDGVNSAAVTGENTIDIEMTCIILDGMSAESDINGYELSMAGRTIDRVHGMMLEWLSTTQRINEAFIRSHVVEE